MNPGDAFADQVVEAQVGPTLYRVRGPAGAGWLRVGPAALRDRANAFVNLGIEGFGPYHLVEHGDQVGLLVVAPESIGILEVTQAQLFVCLQQFGGLLQSLHLAGQTLDSLDPEGLRVGAAGLTVIPTLEPLHPWLAPEGPGEPAADWFLFGLLVYASLTGLQTFAWWGEGNGPDPRDRSPRSPEVLSALAMDLLLLDPEERPDGREILDELVEPTEGPVEDAVDRLLRNGGLAILGSDWSVRVQSTPGSLELGQPSKASIELVERVSALSKRARTQIAALLQHPEALPPAHLARAARQLGQALAIAGVTLAYWRVTDERQQAIVVDVLRARPCPAVVVISDVPLPSLVDLCTASGIRVDGDLRDPGEALAVLPFSSSESILWTGKTDDLNDALGELGVPRRVGLAGRALDTVADWVGPRGAHPTLQDASRARTAARLAAELAWVRPERAVLVARWARREALRAGDPESGAMVHLVDAALTGGAPAGDSDSEHAEDVSIFGRALAQRHRGDARAVVTILDDALPLVSMGAAENGSAGLLLAEALVDTGQWKRADVVLRSLQVDARRTGNRLLDLGCLALGRRMNLDVDEELERVAAQVDTGDGVLAWWLARARATRLLHDPHAALEVLSRCRVFDLWPLRLAGAAAVEARMFRMQVGWAAGEPVGPIDFVHPRTEAWRALGDAVDAKRAGDPGAVITALDRAYQRFEGAHAPLLAAASLRLVGMWSGGARGGNLVTEADAAFHRQGRHNPAAVVRILLPGS